MRCAQKHTRTRYNEERKEASGSDRRYAQPSNAARRGGKYEGPFPFLSVSSRLGPAVLAGRNLSTPGEPRHLRFSTSSGPSVLFRDRGPGGREARPAPSPGQSQPRARPPAKTREESKEKKGRGAARDNSGAEAGARGAAGAGRDGGTAGGRAASYPARSLCWGSSWRRRSWQPPGPYMLGSEGDSRRPKEGPTGGSALPRRIPNVPTADGPKLSFRDRRGGGSGGGERATRRRRLKI